jgi:hypothetical protein
VEPRSASGQPPDNEAEPLSGHESAIGNANRQSSIVNQIDNRQSAMPIGNRQSEIGNPVTV